MEQLFENAADSVARQKLVIAMLEEFPVTRENVIAFLVSQYLTEVERALAGR